MSQFVYLYRRPPQPAATPQQMQQNLQKWRAWFGDLEAKGHLASIGQPLDNTSGGVVKDAKGSFSDGPYAETKDIVIGFSIVEATDLRHAMELTAGCPIYAQDGMVEVRPIMKM